MRTIQTDVFQYSELSESAQSNARDWFRTASQGDDIHDHVYEDAATTADLLGVDLCLTRTNNGDYKPSIQYSGFWSQGDGASFDCNYRYKPGSVKAVALHTGNDKTLIRIASELQAIQKRHFYKLRAKSKVSGHYAHSGCMRIDVWHSDDEYRDIGDAESGITDCLRSFADWIYSQLEREYDYQNSDEAVTESILCNEYEFTEDGKRA